MKREPGSLKYAKNTNIVRASAGDEERPVSRALLYLIYVLELTIILKYAG